jgi:hypothetical protein
MEREDEIRKAVNSFGQDDTTYKIPSNKKGKINLGTQVTFSTHRSGWAYAMRALKPIHNKKGVYFHGFLEDVFCWRKNSYEEGGLLPFKHKWCGFLHNPASEPNRHPNWFWDMYSGREIIKSDAFKYSLDNCIGLWTLSESHAEFLRKETGKTISSLIHPSEIPEVQFDFNKFKENKSKRIINIGYWLRKINSIDILPVHVDKYIKTRVLPFHKDSVAYGHFLTLKKLEFKHEHWLRSAWGKYNNESYNRVDELNRIPDEDYDNLFVDNIAFLDMYDSSANNAVIECIARCTPLLVNRIPSIVEYLGVNYPFYFESLEEAAEKAMDENLIKVTSEHMRHNVKTRKKLTPEAFLKDFVNSEVYKKI